MDGAGEDLITLVVTPPTAEDLFQQGAQLQLEGEINAAALAYSDCILLDPNHAFARSNLGLLFREKGHHEYAVKLQESAAVLAPASQLIWSNLGVCLDSAGRLQDAIAAYEKSLAAGAENALVLSNYAKALNDTGRHDEALRMVWRVIELEPDFADAHTNEGVALFGLGDIPSAVASLRRAVALAPHNALAHFSLAIVLLTLGELEEGWREYAWRWHTGQWAKRPHSQREWGGEEDGALLVWSEQGLGDEILQAGLVGDIADRPGGLVWEVDARLIPLLRRTYPQVTFTARAEAAPADFGTYVKYQISALDLAPRLRPPAGAFPHRRGYLQPDPARVAQIRAQLGLAAGEKLIGISWRSHNARFGAKKSCPLAEWAPVLATPGARFVDLQYGDTAAERAAAPFDLPHVDGLDLTQDLDGLAALISLCAYVITVSNTTAHLAAALGVQTWILASRGGTRFWYWGAEHKQKTPWYPTAHIIRQEADWAATMELTARDLNWLLKTEVY